MRIAVLLTSVAAGLSASIPTGDPEPQIDEIFAAYNRTDSPGCAVGVIQHGQLVFAKGYGMASLELSVPITPQTVFYVGSTSKQFVAAATVLAAMDGYLSLDDDIRRYVPEMPDYGTPITLRHLVHHTSGIRDYLSLMALGGWPWENVYSDEWTLDLIARQEALNFDPGSRYRYSNSGYYLLATIVGRATGGTLRDFADRRMFQPLGMVHTHFHDDRHEIDPGRAMAYAEGEDGGYVLQWFVNFDKVGSGGLHTTVEDLLLWDRAFYDDRLGDGFRSQMLQRGVLASGDTLDYALGLTHGERLGRATVRHGGAFMGFRAEHLRFPDDSLSVSVLCNLASSQPSRLADEVAAVFLPASQSPGAPDSAESRQPTTLPAGTLEALAGAYRDEERRTVWRMVAGDGVLHVEGSPGPLTFVPRDPHHFVARDAPVPVEAYFLPDGTGFRVSVNDAAWGRFAPVELVDPSADVLAAYAGRYYSEELDAVYTVAVRHDTLTVRRARQPPENLEATTVDAFQSGGDVLEFWRTDGVVTGLTLTSGRAGGLRFHRTD